MSTSWGPIERTPRFPIRSARLTRPDRNKQLAESSHAAATPVTALVPLARKDFPKTTAGALAKIVHARIRLNAKDYAGAASLLDSSAISQYTVIGDYGLWMRANALEQAKVAAANTAGKMSFYQGVLPVTILKCLGIPLVSMGEICEDGDGISSKTRHDLKAGAYRRVVFRDGIPIGGILLGTTHGMGEMRKLIENGLELERLRRKVVPDDMVAASA